MFQTESQFKSHSGPGNPAGVAPRGFLFSFNFANPAPKQHHFSQPPTQMALMDIYLRFETVHGEP